MKRQPKRAEAMLRQSRRILAMQRQPKRIEVVVSVDVPYGMQTDITPGLIESYVRDAVQGWMGGYEGEHELRNLESQDIKVQTMNRYMSRNIGAFQLA